MAINVEDPWRPLREAADYRTFIKLYLDHKSLKHSDLARACGFARGFPSDVLSGRRRLTAKSCHAFEKGMKSLPMNGRKLFRMLVAKAEPDVFPELTDKKVSQSIESLRKKPWTRTRRNLSAKSNSVLLDVFQSSESATIYAAAGNPEAGASIDELEARTGFPTSKIYLILKKMIKVGLITEKTDERFYPEDLHLFVDSQEAGNEVFKSLFTQACKAAGQRMPKAMTSDSEFFFSSHLCVAEKDLPRLKKALKETILQFADDAISHDGDRMVQLTTAFHR